MTHGYRFATGCCEPRPPGGPEQANGLAARQESKGLFMLRFLLYMHTALGNALGDRMDDRGATAVEYGLIVTLIAVVIIVTVTRLGQLLNQEFQTVVNAL